MVITLEYAHVGFIKWKLIFGAALFFRVYFSATDNYTLLYKSRAI